MALRKNNQRWFSVGSYVGFSLVWFNHGSTTVKDWFNRCSLILASLRELSRIIFFPPFLAFFVDQGAAFRLSNGLTERRANCEVKSTF